MCISKIFKAAQWNKIRCLGVLPFFKPALKYFIDIVSLGSFGKAAKHNYISQSAVSQQITAMEDELGFPLFWRSKGKAALTLAGKCFYGKVQSIYDNYCQAVRFAKYIYDENNGIIRIGLTTSSRMDYLASVVQDFQSTYRSIKIHFEQMTFGQMQTALNEGKIDLAITIRYNIEDLEDIKIQSLGFFKMGLLVSRQSPLSRWDTIPSADIASQPIIMHTPEDSGGVFRHMLEMRKKEGYVPKITRFCDSSEIVKMQVMFNQGVAFFPEIITIYDNKTCKMLRIIDSEDYVDLVIAHKKNSPSIVHNLAKRIRAFYQDSFDAWYEGLKREINWTFPDSFKHTLNE